jgi:hypothetical protein
MVIAEFVPVGATPQVFQQLFTTGTALGRTTAPAVDLAPKTIDGIRVSLDASEVTAGGRKGLTARFEDAASGTPVADLEPLFGASGHLFAVPVDLTDAVDDASAEGVRGPALTFTPLLPRAGRYKVWVQFQRAGRVCTATFVIDVP